MKTIPLLLFASLSTWCLAAVSAEETPETRKTLAGKVVPLLKERCAACHSPEAEKIRGDFGTVTLIDKLRESDELDLDSPEDSELYQQARDQLMPELTKEQKAAGKTEPDYFTDEEVALLLSWIRAGAPDLDGSVAPLPVVAETPPSPVTPEAATAPASKEPAPANSLPPAPAQAGAREVVTEIAAHAAAVRDLLALKEGDRQRVRYVSVVPLHNDTGISDDQLKLLRQGVAKLLNSLSTNPLVATFPEVGPQGVLYRVDLDDIGWDAALWDEVAAFYPYAIQGNGTEALTGVTGSKISVLRADWLAATATRGQLYNRILGIPATLKELETKLGIDIAKNLANGKAPRAGFTSSGVSRANRLVERHEIRAYPGQLWISYDFRSSADHASIHDFPLGPEGAHLAGGAKAFKEAGGELIWTLPNGFYAYLIVNTLGDRLDGPAPTDIVADREAITGRSEVINAISCMICHQAGVRDLPADEIRPLAGGASFTAVEKQLIEQLHIPTVDMAALVEKDREAFHAKLADAGVGLVGKEPIRTLVEAYDAPVKLARAAAELGLVPTELEKATKASGATLELYLRLATGGFPRDAFETNKFPELALRLSLGEVVKPTPLKVTGEKPSAEAKEGDAAAPIVPLLTAPKRVFHDGEVMEISVTSPVDGHVQVIYQDAAGKNILLFPNSLQTDDTLHANQPLVLSGAAAPNEVVVQAPFGKETVVAIVSDQPFANADAVLQSIKNAKDQSRVFVEFDEKRLEVNVVKSVRLRAKGARIGSARLELETAAK